MSPLCPLSVLPGLPSLCRLSQRRLQPSSKWVQQGLVLHCSAWSLTLMRVTASCSWCGQDAAFPKLSSIPHEFRTHICPSNCSKLRVLRSKGSGSLPNNSWGEGQASQGRVVGKLEVWQRLTASWLDTSLPVAHPHPHRSSLFTVKS